MPPSRGLFIAALPLPGAYQPDQQALPPRCHPLLETLPAQQFLYFMNNNLPQLAAHLTRLGFTPTYRGDPYGRGLDWLYFDCFFHEAAVRRHFGLGPETRYVAYDGRAAGQEAGFYDPRTGFGLMGHHPGYGRANSKPEITGAELKGQG